MDPSSETVGNNNFEIRIRRIYDPPMPDDGFRILVDRLWPRGVSKEKAEVDLWLKEIAPSDELRRWFGHDPKLWEEFKARYFDELALNQAALAELSSRLWDNPRITLLFAAKEIRYNNAQALKEFLITHFTSNAIQGRLSQG